jgi:hypothetical protein
MSEMIFPFPADRNPEAVHEAVHCGVIWGGIPHERLVIPAKSLP